MLPKASILWVNYNSKPIIDIALSSLSAINDLDYPNLELVIVDNGSTDGSFNIIKEFADKMKVERKIYRSTRNLGFTGGNNIAYRLIDRDSKYVVLLNNDAIPYPESLREIVEYMQEMPWVGAAQGIVFKIDGSGIDTAGNFLDELLTVKLLSKAPKRVIPISYPSGSYTVIKRSALREVGLIDRIFVDEVFAYFDDAYLGMMFWNNGYKTVTIPVKAAKHCGGATFKRYNKLQMYMWFRSWVTMVEITNSRWRWLIRMSYSGLLTYFTMMRSREEVMILLRAIKDGRRLARKINKYFDIYKMPIVRISIKDLLKLLTARGMEERRYLRLRKVLQLIGEGGEGTNY